MERIQSVEGEEKLIERREKMEQERFKTVGERRCAKEFLKLYYSESHQGYEVVEIKSFRESPDHFKAKSREV